MNTFTFFRNRKWPNWTADAIALIGLFLYLAQAVIYARTSIPGLDEGSYLYKGILFLTGVYKPFEPYGPLTNKAPLAFLIPGTAEFIFGAGLRTGRTFAVFLGVLTVLGTWIVARRFGGKWLAAGAVWVFALSPMIIKIHAIADSEVIIAAMLAWMCVLAVGEDCPAWKVILGSVLAALTILTRQNMVVVLPLLVLYILWQRGLKMAIWAALAGCLVLIIGHAVYWPNILTIWAPWLSPKLTPFLDAFRLPKDVTPTWAPSIDLGNRVIAFFQGIRYHFIPAAGSFAALILWMRPRAWKSSSLMKAGVFLAVLYFLLFILHAWAAVASQYDSYSCVFCFMPYLTFFDPLGILLLVVTISGAWKRNPSLMLKIASILFVVIFSGGMGLSAFENVDEALLSLPVPRVRDGQILSGSTTLSELMSNKFALSAVFIKKYLALSLGLAAGLAILFLAFLLWRRIKTSGVGFAAILINSYLALGLLLSPFLSMGGSQKDCNEDLIAANEIVGHHLASIIPPNSLVYWDGGLSFTPMTYVPDARIFPPQINDGYTHRIGGDTDLLYRFSHWNDELDQEWKSSADVFIIEEKRYDSWKSFLTPQEFEEYQRPPLAPSCEDGAGLRIFHRKP